MDINVIVLNQVKLLSSYIDELRSHFNIIENHSIEIYKIYYDKDVYTIIYEIRPSQYLYVHIGQSLSQLKQNLIKLFDNENINIIDIDLNIDNEKIIISVKYGLKQINILPTEILMNVLIDLPYKDIKNYCSTSIESDKICQSDFFWKTKLMKEYPDLEIKYETGRMEGYYEIQEFINYYNNTNMDIKEILGLESLYLSDKEIEIIPDSIGLLTNLKDLYFGYNKIEIIPDSIGKLTNLKNLYIDNNKIEIIPDSIGLLTNLKNLYLQNNKIEIIPDSIGLLTNLKSLNLHYNKIEELPDSIGLLTNLKSLYLQNNKIEIIPDSIGLLTNLKSLYLHYNKIEELPDSIGNLTNLRDLYIDKNVYISPLLASKLAENNVKIEYI